MAKPLFPAAQFEKGGYDDAIATCETAVEEARSVRILT